MQSLIQMSPIQWASLPDIADVPAISGADHECLDAIREVLIRHNAIGRKNAVLPVFQRIFSMVSLAV